MSKKVLAINSSRRKKFTYGILVQLKEQFKKMNIDVDIIHLHDYKIQDCIGCESCIRSDQCHMGDDVNELMNKMTRYDGIILSTPIYMNQVSGKLKTFVDRTCKWVHRPELTGIPVMCIVTTSASGIPGTLKYLENVAMQWGAFPTAKVSRKVTTLNDKVLPKEYEKFTKYLMMPKELYRPSLNQLIYFAVYKVLALKIIERDTDYWKQKGWHSKEYFFDAKIDIFKKIISKAFYKMLYKKVNKV